MYQLEWEKTNEGNARLLCMKETPAELVLPEKIKGLPLTEVGPYCFKNNKFIERVTLPDTIKKIDRMAFYNCTGLRELELGAAVTEFGGDAFMNCHNLHNLLIRCGAYDKSGARLVLQQISSDMRVHFMGDMGKEEALILFPEYYETYDEVAPAHLFGRNIEGEGFRARQCFKEGIFEYTRYDSIFQKACAEEQVTTLCEMALNRLIYPVGLAEAAKRQYMDFTKSHMDVIGKKVIVSRDITTLQFLCERQLVNRETFDQFIPLAAENEWAEGTVFLLRLKEQHFPQKEKTDKYDFDEF